MAVLRTKEAHGAPLRLCMVEGFAPQVCGEEPLCNLGMAEGRAGLLLFALGLEGEVKAEFRKDHHVRFCVLQDIRWCFA